jgi:hypothetical protein
MYFFAPTFSMIRKVVPMAVVALLVTTSSWAAPAKEKPKMRWTSYRSNVLKVQVTVPSAWVPRKSNTALGFLTPGPADQRAAVGILKSNDQTSSIDQLADQQFSEPSRPQDWVRVPARVAGMRAIKIVGTAKDNADRKMVQYYVETPNGTYLLQCIAPLGTYPLYSDLFATMLTKLQFLP